MSEKLITTCSPSCPALLPDLLLLLPLALTGEALPVDLVAVPAAFLSLGDSGDFFLNAFFAGEEVFEFFFGVASGWCVWGVNVLPIGTKHFGINFILCREAAVTLNKALEFIMAHNVDEESLFFKKLMNEAVMNA